jgi:DNA repair protein RadD
MTMVTLRSYQSAAVDAIWNALRNGIAAPLAVLPTGAGKSPVVAHLCNQSVMRWGGRVLVLVHVKELVQQLAESVRRAWPDPFCPIGVLSAGLGSRTIDAITVAGIQSAYRRACDIGRIDLVIIDEAHLVPPDGDGMYRTLLGELRIINPKLRLVGLTATPYRLGHGRIDEAGGIWSCIVHQTGVKELMTWPAEEGGPYLSRIVGKDGGAPDLAGVHRRGGEWIAEELEEVMSDREQVSGAVAEIMRYAPGRKAGLIFCCGVRHAGLVSEAMAKAGEHAPLVTGETPGDERDRLIADFKAGRLRWLVNVNVLTTGFDAPHVDLVALLRPTESPGLYYQMVGRGFRLAPGKSDCLVLDLAGNIARHGPIDTLNERILAPGAGGGAPTKTCLSCQSIHLAGLSHCPDCGTEFQRRCPWCEAPNPWTADVCGSCGKPTTKDARHETRAGDGNPIDGEPAPPPCWYEVDGIDYLRHEKKGAGKDHPKTLRVDYYDGMLRVASEWVCVEHQPGSFAFSKAWDWMQERLINGWRLEAEPEPALVGPDGARRILTATDAAWVGRHNGLRCPARIAVQPDGKYQRIADYDWTGDATREPGADEDEPAMASASEELNDDDLPF